MEKGTWKYSVTHSKCPRCNEGDLWVNPKTYSKHFDKMHPNCSHCNLVYDMEQGFWYGAMYISYAMGVAITVAVFVALSVLTDLSIFAKSGIATLFLIALVPVMFRFSRNIWLNIFVRFDKNFIQNPK